MEELQERSLQRSLALGAQPAEDRRLKVPQLRLALISLGLIVALGGLIVSIVLAAPDVENNFARFWPLSFAGFPTMGALVLWRKPGNRIGLIMLWIGITAGIPQMLTAAAVTVSDERLSATLERVGNSIPIDWILVIALLVLFPSGMTSSRTLKWLLRFLFAVTPFLIGFAIVSDEPLPASLRENPLAVPALSAWSKVAVDSFVIVPLSALIALVAMVRRWRKATGSDRLQYRWFALGIGALVLGVAAISLPETLFPDSPASPTVEAFFNTGVVAAIILGVNAVPVAVGIAVLRYRLYEIDRLVSRTASYALIVAVLGLLYVGVVYLTQRVIGTENQLTVAASTLAVAAAFNPLRRRIQRIVDHRFNRSRFDAEREVANFAARLRASTDLSAVTTDLSTVVSETVGPSKATIWIR